MTGPIHHGRGAVLWLRLIPARGPWSRPAAPAPQPLAGSCQRCGGVSSPAFAHPAPSVICHPAEGMAAGLRVEGTGLMRRARQQGWEAAAGAEDPAAAGNRWGSAAGAPTAKRALHPAAVPLLLLPWSLLCRSSAEPTGPSWRAQGGFLGADGWRPVLCIPRVRPGDGPEAPASSVLMAGGCWVSSWVPGEEERAFSLIIQQRRGIARPRGRAAGDADGGVPGTGAFG